MLPFKIIGKKNNIVVAKLEWVLCEGSCYAFAFAFAIGTVGLVVSGPLFVRLGWLAVRCATRALILATRSSIAASKSGMS